LFGVTSRAQLKKSNPGPKYFNAILDTLGIETSVANRITMSADLDPARFKWVFYVDPVLFPFDTTGLAARNTDQAAFMPNQTKLQQRFRQQVGLTSAPADLAGYLTFVTHVLEDHQRRGAVAAKFEVAYFRSFVFAIRRARRSSRSMPATSRAASPVRRNTRHFRIWCSATC
jgi:hypothetical protein